MSTRDTKHNLKHNLEKISGIGKILANELIDAGVKSIKDLKKDKYYNMLSNEAKLELKYDFCEIIDKKISDELITYLPTDWIPVGSHRRCIQDIHDLDFLCLSDLQYASNMLNMLSIAGGKFKVINEYLSGDKRKSYVLQLNFKSATYSKCNYIKIDIFKTTNEDLPFALFHYTGNKNFNIRTRAQAKRLGYKLNQYGLFDNNGVKITVKDEKEIFKILNVTYKEPCERND